MPDPTCSLDGCDRYAVHRGWCDAHYQRWLACGDPAGSGKPPIVRRKPPRLFWDYVTKTDGCWLWTGFILTIGYGTFTPTGRKAQLAHRMAYQELVGPIPEGLVIDHLCRVRHCVNPAHMEAVTDAENILRGVGASAMNARKTHCKWGHEFTPDNIYWVRNGKTRSCRICAIRHAAAGKRRARARARARARVSPV